ncbi:MAG: hypothetical protein ABII81_10980 [Pseudomonadota bacterium]
MKKVALSLAGVLAAAAFAPEASAIPAFARQTGMACSACHAQHFPILNGFGRAFKAAGFTMMGAQEKVEGEHLSIPATMNLGVLLKVRYQKSNGTASATLPDGATTNHGQWQFPDEYAFFIGGRVADNGATKVGVMMENALGGTDAGIAAGLRVPVVYEMDAAKLSVIPFTTDGLGPFYGYSESSAGVVRSIRWAEHRNEISAHQYTGMGSNAATGFAFVAHTDMGYINVTRYSPLFASNLAQKSTAVHAAFTPTIGDFATIFSVEALSGTADIADNSGFALDATDGTINPATEGLAKVPTKGTGFSAQAHGELAGMETGFYFQNSKVDKGSYAGDKVLTGEKTATTIGADFTVIPHVLSLGAAIRSAKNNNVSDNATTFTAVYDLAQNVAVVANYTKYSDKALQSHGGDNLLTMMLEAAW